MEVTILAGILGGIVFLVWLSRQLNAYSEEMYDYSPIGFGTIFLAMIPYILIIGGVFFNDASQQNLTMAVLFGGVSIVGLFLWIAKRSSIYVALAAMVLLLIIALPMLLILFGSRNKNDEYYYYD